MTCLSKIFSLTYETTMIESDFTSQIGYLAEKWSQGYSKRVCATNVDL